MKLPTELLRKVERRLARVRERRVINLNFDQGIVCFTFDDARRSACNHGAALLENYGARGTFYISGGLTGTDVNHTTADIVRLADAGHEIGCHGFAHRSYQSFNESEILADLAANRAFFKHLSCSVPKNFSYPFGHVSPFAKRVLTSKFNSLRGISPGINHGATDLALLKSFALYGHRWTEAEIDELLLRNARLRGLLMFFTHGVTKSPGEFDCSTKLLDFAIRRALASSNKVMTVQSALDTNSTALKASNSSMSASR